jgi:hypothetical protein
MTDTVRVFENWTVTAVIISPEPMGSLVRNGAASLVDDAAAAELDAADWFRQVADERRAGIEVHGVVASVESLPILRDKWTVLLRTLVDETPELAGWSTDVSIQLGDEDAEDLDGPEDDELEDDDEIKDDDHRGGETGHGASKESTNGDDEDALDVGYRQSLIRAAEDFRAVPMEYLLPSGFDDLAPDNRGAALLRATYLAGCVVHAAATLTDHLFDDVEEVRRAGKSGGAVDVDSLWVLSQLPPRFSKKYDPLFAQKFLVAFVDMTRRITGGWEPLANVAQELAVRVLLNEVVVPADLADVDLPDDWRADLEEYLLEDLDHEYLYDPAYDGFEEETDFGPPGMAPMRFRDWFVPFAAERHLPVYATDRPQRA